VKIEKPAEKCPGIQNRKWLEFAHVAHGRAIVCGNKCIGIFDGDELRSPSCGKVSEGHLRCSECQHLANYLSKAISDDVFQAKRAPLNPRQQEHVDQLMKKAGGIEDNSVDSKGERLLGQLREALRCGRLKTTSFTFEFLETQAFCLNSVSPSAFRYSKEVYRFSRSLAFLGGKQVIDHLRGNGDRDGEHKPENFALFLPSVRSLRKHSPIPRIYDSLHEDRINQIALSLSCQEGGLVGDEIEVRYGFTFVEYLNLLVGWADHGIPAHQVEMLDEMSAGEINSRFATKVFQVFFVASDGKTCVPVGFKGSTGITGEEAFRVFEKIARIFDEHGIRIRWGSTDGISSNKKLMALMNQKFPGYIHIFDPSHLLKNLRNDLQRMDIITPDCPEGFSMKTLYNLTLGPNGGQYHDLFGDSLYPQDRMDVNHFKRLINPELLSLLREEKDPSVKGVLRYLQVMKQLSDGCLENYISAEEREHCFDHVIRYFVEMKHREGTGARVSDNLIEQILQTCRGMKILAQEYESFIASIFGTLIVENFFSQVRGKTRYPSLYEYALYYNRAHEELVKKFADDYLYPSIQTRKGKKYGNQEGYSSSSSSLFLFFPFFFF